jgi:alpha-L-fucosidase
MLEGLAILALVLGVARTPAPTCKTSDGRVEAAIAAKVRELKGQERCQYRHYETLSDVDGDGRPDFIMVFAVEGMDGGNDVKQFLLVSPSAGQWTSRITECGARGTRLVETIEVKERVVVLHTSEYRPTDAMCCPSAKGVATFRLEGQGLVEVKVGTPAEAPGQAARPTRAATRIAEGGNDQGYDMAPETRREVVEAAAAAAPKIPSGPVQPTWESLAAHYKVPQWFTDAKFGLFMHWGLYSVPAYHNEWYEKHMYARFLPWHTQHFGPPSKFGYKDFIPKFTAAKWDPVAWAELFKASGARYVIPTAQHHDNFALWDSDVTPWNAKRSGPKRDLIGELAQAVRAQGLKFGVSNHGIENFQFVNPAPELLAQLKADQADLYDPQWAAFYNVADRSDEACTRFLVDWARRNAELIDKYRPDMLWFDNGVDVRYLDPLKLWVAAYYYNRAEAWGQPVSLSTKKAAYAPSGTNTQTIGSIVDFEKIGSRSPSDIRTGAWQVDEPIGSTWGYTSDMTVAGPGAIVAKLADTVSKNGNLLLNLSPTADGTIPEAQQTTLREIGRWLAVNGDAIYGTHGWTRFGEGGEGRQEVRFTVKGEVLFAIMLGDVVGKPALIGSLATGQAPPGRITNVSLLGGSTKLAFTQDGSGLKVALPETLVCKHACVLKIEGLKMNPPTATLSGNPS